MSNLIQFDFDNTPIRIIKKQGEPWFVANDVCAILGLANPRQALTALDDDEKADVSLTDTSSNGVKQSRTVNIISESGLYVLILRSRKATEKGTIQHKFRKWVTTEVLPTIRKTGTYTLNTPQPHAIHRTIDLLAAQMAYKNPVKTAIYAHLHRTFDVQSIAQIDPMLYGEVRMELARMEWMLRPYISCRRQIESHLVRSITQDQPEAVWSAIRQIEEAAYSVHGEFTAELDRLAPAALSYGEYSY